MSKQVMEINGVANIKMLLELETSNANGQVVMNKETMDSVKHQLEMLERYMLAFNKALQSDSMNPYWHEVLRDPKLYPTNRERK
jgi:hypothetical protein